MDLSVVIPLYNEESLAEELVKRTLSSVTPLTPEFEIIFVDDGSTDQTVNLLMQARSAERRIKILVLSKNFGHQAAFTAGLKHASGSCVVMLDGDLEDPPELIPQLYRMIKEGQWDVVSGKRSGAGEQRRRLVNHLFHKLFRRASGFGDLENAGHFSAMNRQALEAILSFRETIRYLPGLRKLIGFRQGFIEYSRSPRKSGRSKMTTSRLINLGSDAIFSFSNLPVKICLYLGLAGILVFFGAGLYTLVAKIAGFAIPGWSSTLLSIYFLGSIQLTFMGILGEYVYRIYKESQQRPIYFVKEFHQ